MEEERTTLQREGDLFVVLLSLWHILLNPYFVSSSVPGALIHGKPPDAAKFGHALKII